LHSSIMPELPELRGMACVINMHAKGKVYIKCDKSAVSKQPKVRPPAKRFTITAESRGKELIMRLEPAQPCSGRPMFVLCGAGMTGFFEGAASAKAVHKHAHLRFYATDGTVLSFVDQRRFGTWQPQAHFAWGAQRGPDPVSQHLAFRQNVLSAVKARPARFERAPICQVLHDQSLFNGIGNYLRAEVLLRAGVPPFAPAKEVFERLAPAPTKSSAKKDLLELCRIVPQEVMKMKLSKYQGGQAKGVEDTGGEHSKWMRWLQVYGHDDASWATDKEGRRIWFRGAPGKLFSANAKDSHLVKGAAATRTSAKGRGSVAKGKSAYVTRRSQDRAASSKTPASDRAARVIAKQKKEVAGAPAGGLKRKGKVSKDGTKRARK